MAVEGGNKHLIGTMKRNKKKQLIFPS